MIQELISGRESELLSTLITIIILLSIRFVGNKTVRKIGRVSEIAEARTLLITKYMSIALTFLGIGALTFIWSVDFQKLGILFSSIFAVIGVALFAQWSILSNVTSGVILFFSFPFKIGDRIKIMDKELLDVANLDNGVYIIEDIKAFHLHLRSSNGQRMTYPNNLILQKAVALVNTYEETQDGVDVL